MGIVKPGLDGDAVQMAAVSVGDLKASHGSAEYIQGIENQRAMKVGTFCLQHVHRKHFYLYTTREDIDAAIVLTVQSVCP